MRGFTPLTPAVLKARIAYNERLEATNLAAADDIADVSRRDLHLRIARDARIAADTYRRLLAQES